MCERCSGNGDDSHESFPYANNTRKLSRVSGLASMVCTLAKGSKEKGDGTEFVRPSAHEEFTNCGTLFEFGEAAWLHYLKKKMDPIDVLFLDLKRRALEGAFYF